MKIKVINMLHYRKCRKTRTKMERGIKEVVKASYTNDNKKYTHAEVYVWKDSSIAFLDFKGGTDILCIGKKAQEFVESHIDESRTKKHQVSINL